MAVSISSAVLTDTTLVIGGSGFGTKPTAAPHRFRPWTGLTNGSDASGQFDDIEFVGTGFDATRFTVDNSDGIGGGSLKINYDCKTLDTELFPHHEFSLPSTDYVYLTYWILIDRVTNDNGGGNYHQIKATRAGVSSGSGPAENYGVNPKFATSWVSYEPTNTGDIWVEGHSVQIDNTDTTFNNNANPSPAIWSDNQWHCVEVEMQMNTVSVADAVFKLWVDNVLIVESTNTLMRDSASQHFEYLQISPGYAGDLVWNDWIEWSSRHYVDVSSCRVFLGNASTHSACTSKFILNLSAHSTSSITATNAESIPSGHDWVYVVDDTGTPNSSGYAYTGGEPGSFQAAWAINSNQIIGTLQ